MTKERLMIKVARLMVAVCLLASVLSQGREVVSRTPLAVETFDEVWKILHESHFDTNFNGHNWEEVREKFRPRAAAARTREDFREVVQEMLDLLAVSHLAIVPGEFTEEMELDEPAEKETKNPTGVEEADEDDSGTLGMELRYAEKNLLVTRVEANLPAEKAGVKP